MLLSATSGVDSYRARCHPWCKCLACSKDKLSPARLEKPTLLKADMKLDEFINKVSQTVDDSLAEANPNDLSPYVIGRLLSDIAHLLQEFTRNYKDNDVDASSVDCSRKLTFLQSLLKGLGDNFFPMAHTNERLEKLKIITIDELTELLVAIGKLQKVSACCRSYIHEISRRSQLALSEQVTRHRQFFQEEPTSIDEVLQMLSSAEQRLHKLLRS